MKNPRIILIDSVCEWFGVTPYVVMESSVRVPSTSEIKNKVRLQPEQKAWAMMCSILTSHEMRDLKLEADQLAEFFNVEPEKVKIALNQHLFLSCSSESYKIVYSKITEVLNQHLQPIYDESEF